ncbi:MAG: glycoside hydrolase family 32 protein [Phycisphaerales bacterium]
MLILAAVLALVAARPSDRPDDIVIADFESDSYAPWVATGEAFGHGPARGALPNQMRVEGYQGSRLVNTYFQGDESIGTLTSPEFKVERPYVSFLIGGGKDLENTCIQLLIGDAVFRVATGPNDRPGGSERLSLEGWDVRDLVGKSARIRIIDNARGGWGHINVDQIVQTDRKPPTMLTNVRREFNVGARYLNIPIKNGAPLRRVSFFLDGVGAGGAEMELADGAPDWWAPIDLSMYQGRSIALEVDSLRDDSAALSSISLSDTMRDSENLYDEPLRAQFHFSSRRGWLNDPNGLVYFNGEYHMFYQHCPFCLQGWAAKYWGHAVSKDLVHWTELDDAVAPDARGPVWSGSAVVDRDNTSGLGKPGAPAMVMFYTAAGNPFTQCLVSSTDGRTFTKLATNPVVGNIASDNRDPKVTWHAPSKQWIMTLWVGTEGKPWIYFLGSTNLREWKQLSRVEGFYECPDFFELPLDGDPAHTKWVLTAASSEYMVGSFDGTTFTPETPKLPGHRGRGFYAAQTFSDMPDGRRVQIGWFQTETPGMAFNQSMTIPLELSLVSTPDGPRLRWNPARELEALRVRSRKIGPMTVALGCDDYSRNTDLWALSDFQAELLELRTEIEPLSDVVLWVRGTQIDYFAGTNELHVKGQNRVKVPLVNGKLQLTIYCDRVGMEIFAAGGLVYIPMALIPNAEDRSVSIAALNGEVKINSLVVHELRSAWKGK